MEDTDDADLELLRQAALSSLLKKKNTPSSTNALFYNPSAKPNLISIEPVQEEYYDKDNDEYSTEYVIAEGLSVSSSDVDEIVEEVMLSEDDEDESTTAEEESSEGEDAVSVASKDSFDEILNSIEEEVKGAKSLGKKINPTKRSRRPSAASINRGNNGGSRKLPPRRSSTNRRNRSRSSDSKNNRRPMFRKISPISLARRRSPRDRISGFADNRRRTTTGSPAENRRPRSRSPTIKRRLSPPRSTDGRRLRRSRSPSNNNIRVRSPITFEPRRRDGRSPHNRRPILDRNRRYGRRSRSRSPVKLSEDLMKNKSPKEVIAKSPLGTESPEEFDSHVRDECAQEDFSNKKSQSPENRKISEALKLNSGRQPKPDRELYQRRPANQSRERGNREQRSRSRTPDRTRNRRGYNQINRRSPIDKSRRRTPSKSPPAKRKLKSRTPSPDTRNLSQEELDVFEKRKRKFQGSVNVNSLSGKIKLKSTRTRSEVVDTEDKTDSQNSYSDRDNVIERTIIVSDRKAELSSRLGEIVHDSSLPGSEASGDGVYGRNSNSIQEDEPKIQSNPDDGKGDLRTKLQQKRSIGMGRIFSVALQDTLSTSSEDIPKKPIRNVSASFK